MSAAWFLKQNGYRQVRVFEKIERVGGKCLTFDYEGRQFDMAAHEMLAGYGDVMDIATALKVPTTGYQNVLVYDRGSRRYMDMLTATQSGGYGKLQVVWASLRYTWMLLTRFRSSRSPGPDSPMRHPNCCSRSRAGSSSGASRPCRKPSCS